MMRIEPAAKSLGNWRVLADTPVLPGLRCCCLATYRSPAISDDPLTNDTAMP